MAGLETLEIVIGLVFVYLLFSTLVTLVVEYISSKMSLRAENLKKIIARALDDDKLENVSDSESENPSDVFYKFPLIKYLGKDGKKPSYISSAKFAKTVLDIIRTGGDSSKLGKLSKLDKESISEAIEGLPMMGNETKAVLMTFAKETEEDINEFGAKLEGWFNETVERGQGWFNRHIKRITLGVSIAIAIILNVDSVRIYQSLSNNPDLREKLVNHATEYVANDTLKNTEEDSILRKKIDDYYKNKIDPTTNLLGIGWDVFPNEYYSYSGGWNFPFWYVKTISAAEIRAWLTAILGWIITGFAISLGAPFWFGVLNKLTALRAAGKTLEEEKKGQNQISKPKPVG
ncbi:hypothetical protein [Ekhidna sp.]|uniref:hypothetical protein n=1 Tax=Ekhidna sp. TaxID=2608089 RepID=UPI0032998874